MRASRDIADSPSLTFSNVEFGHGETVLFSGLSFTISSGEALWIQGDNGIGKTSILKMAAGLSRPVSGSIKWSAGESGVSPRDIIGYLSHHDALNPLLTTLEELEFWADIYEHKGSLEREAERVGLTDRLHVKTRALSAGQKRRLALARLIISNRSIWLMDEPKAAMDKSGRELVDEIIENHIMCGGAVIAATHNLALSLGRNARRLVLESAA